MIHNSRPTLLYVDDTVEQRYAMRRILEKEGYQVLEAGTGREALRLMDDSPLLVILDVKLPDMSGYEVCRRLKEQAPDTPVLQVSASFSDPQLRASGLSGGADAYIAQPVYPAELLSLVRTLLSTAEARNTLRFLASLGLRLNKPHVFPETTHQICEAVIPYFADECYLYIPSVPGESQVFWPEGIVPPEDLEPTIRAAVNGVPTLLDRHTIVAPLSISSEDLGSIAFHLDSDREYTSSDLQLAGEIALRGGVVLQNAILFMQEQATRSALIQSEKLATAGRMSAAIAHEINNPLEAVTNLIYLIESSPDATPEIRDNAGAALSELTRLAHITRQSLGFYRESTSPATVDVNEIVRETLDLYRMRLQLKGISTVLHLTDALLVHAVRGELRQVISNLAVNAIDAMEAGGTLTVISEQHGDRALMRFSDTGSGIPGTTLPRIFDPFYTTKQGTGTGLGLWISRSIIEKHHGTIEVTKSDNDGTTFELQLPTSTDPSA